MGRGPRTVWPPFLRIPKGRGRNQGCSNLPGRRGSGEVWGLGSLSRPHQPPAITGHFLKGSRHCSHWPSPVSRALGLWCFRAARKGDSGSQVLSWKKWLWWPPWHPDATPSPPLLPASHPALFPAALWAGHWPYYKPCCISVVSTCPVPHPNVLWTRPASSPGWAQRASACP